MQIFFNNIIPCVINCFVVIYLLFVILGKKINLSDYRLYVSIIFLLVTAILNFLLSNDLVRFVTSTGLVGIANYYMFRDTINRTVISTIIEQVILAISEVIYVIILIVSVSSDSKFLIDSYYGKMITVVCISCIAIAFANIPFIKKVYNKIMKATDNINNEYIVILVMIFMIVINILLFSVFHGVDLLSILILNILFMIIYGFVLYRGIIDKSNMIKTREENRALANNLSEYEKILDYQRISNHENKNQLLVIKSLLNDGNNDVREYIDEVIKDKKQDDDILLNRAKKIPSGGLQGIIYQKMLVMNDKNIKVLLNVSNSIRNIKFDNINSKSNYDICRIVGVFLDNAIEEVSESDQREINISIYEDDEMLIIEIGNPVRDLSNIECIEKKGFSTKGDNRGHGLSLVKEIVENSKVLINEHSITSNIFTQILKVKV